MLEQQRLGGDGADVAWAQKPRPGDQRVDDEDEELMHP
jgi:hypothetical protein